MGAFVGAALVWLHFLPHFKSLPEPPCSDPDEELLRSRDALSSSALGIASYNTREEDVQARNRGFGDLKRAAEDIFYYLKDSHRMEESADKHATLVEVVSRRKTGSTVNTGAGPLRYASAPP